MVITYKWKNGILTHPETGTKVFYKPASESASQWISESKIVEFSTEPNANLLSVSYIVQEYVDGFECEVPIFKVRDTVYVLP